jgi:hypothetical protein
MTNGWDDELLSRFTALRDAERERVPGFADTLERARTRPRRRLHPLRVMVAGGAVLATVAGVVLLMNRRGHGDPNNPPIIAAWHAPSDVLMPSITSTLLGPLPPLNASVLDAIIR